MRNRNLIWAVLALLATLAFDHMMRADIAQLCATDAHPGMECR